MTKLEAYRYLQGQGEDLAWIANVFYTRQVSAGQANVLKALAFLHRQDYEILSVEYTMPDEYLWVDGSRLTPQEVVDVARRHAQEMILDQARKTVGGG